MDDGPAGGAALANPVWDAWRPAEIARRLARVRAHWYVAGGWALDLTIRLPYQQIVRRTPEGIPYLVPEIVLPFKAKHVRSKDETDFAAMRPLLRPAAIEWLHQALARVHPGHAWLGAL